MTNSLCIFFKNFEVLLLRSGIFNLTIGNVFMIFVGLLFIYLAIFKELEPMILISVGFGILIGNIPFKNFEFSLDEDGSIFNFLYSGCIHGWYSSLIFLGIGAMTDFSSLFSNPKLIFIGFVSQFGIISAYVLAVLFGFNNEQARVISIIGVADGPASIFLASKLSPNLINSVAISAYCYMALVQFIQPPIMHLFTTHKERLIKMESPRVVSQYEKILFPILGIFLTCCLVPSVLPLLGMLFLGNLLKESGAAIHLAKVFSSLLIDVITLFLGISIGVATRANQFFTFSFIKIFILGILSFVIATTIGILFIKVFNFFLKEEHKINPLIGSSGVSAVPHFARISEIVGLKYDSNNYLLMHAMGPNVAGTISTLLAVGVMIEFFK